MRKSKRKAHTKRLNGSGKADQLRAVVHREAVLGELLLSAAARERSWSWKRRPLRKHAFPQTF